MPNKFAFPKYLPEYSHGPDIGIQEYSKILIEPNPKKTFVMHTSTFKYVQLLVTINYF